MQHPSLKKRTFCTVKEENETCIWMVFTQSKVRNNGDRSFSLFMVGAGARAIVRNTTRWRNGWPLQDIYALHRNTGFRQKLFYPAAVHDLKSALRWMRSHAKKENIDTTKIAVLGFSAGGQLAAFLGTTMGNPRFEGDCNRGVSTRVQAIVDMDGTLSFVHPQSGEGDDSRSTSAATYWFGYPKKDNPELWQEASPLTHVGKHTPPVLFINSSVARMHAGREDFISVLNQHGIYSEVHTFPDAPHSFPLFEPWFEPTVTYITGFLSKVFKKEP